MKRIDSLNVVQIRLFRIDEIPLSVMRLDSSIQKMQERFSFQQALPLQSPLSADPQGAVAFVGGQIKIGEKAFVVDRLIVESRRIVLSVSATSSIATSAFEIVRALLKEIDQRESKPILEPVVLTEETITVVHLDFPITHLFSSEAYGRLVAGFSSRTATLGAKTRIVPSSLHFRVSYDDLPVALRESNISLLDKDIAIELRVNTPVEENAFFLTSPNPSNVHMELIELIEQCFGSEAAKH